MMIGFGGRIRISPNGQCTPMNENGEVSEDIRNLHRTKKLDTEPVRTRSGRLKLGYFKHSLEDIITDAFLWLMRQSKGKHIKASKVSTNVQICLLMNFSTLLFKCFGTISYQSTLILSHNISGMPANRGEMKSKGDKFCKENCEILINTRIVVRLCTEVNMSCL
jgi:hypothetical protein